MLCFQDGTCWVSLLRSPSLPVHTRLFPPPATCRAPDVPLQLAFSPHSPASSTLLPPVPSCLPSGTSVLLLCFPGPPSQTPFTSQGFRHPGAGPAELLWLAPAGLGLQEGGLSCTDWCHWKFMGPIAVGCAVLLAILSPVPHQLFLPLSLAVPLDLCHSH